MSKLSLVSLMAGALLLGACATEQADQSGNGPTSTTSASQTSAPTQEATATASKTAEVEDEKAGENKDLAHLPPHDVLYDGSLLFDLRFASELRSDKDQVTLVSEEEISLNELPEDLDKWLSRIKDNGGSVKAQPEQDPDKPKTRMAFLGALLDVVLYFVGKVQEEVTYSSIDDYDAMLFFDEDTSEVTRMVLYKRN